MKNNPIIIERTFNSSIDKVWAAITKPEQMKQWYFDIPEFRPEVGLEFSFSAGESPHKTYLHLCKVMEVVPEKKLSHSWSYDGYEGDSLVTFELFKEENKTRVKLSHSGLETLPASNPDFGKENFVGGWTHIIGESLKKFLEK